MPVVTYYEPNHAVTRHLFPASRTTPLQYRKKIGFHQNVDSGSHRHPDPSPAMCALPAYNVRTARRQHQAHSSVQKAANIAGLGGNMRLIPARTGGGEADDNAYALDAADLAAAMKEDVTAGLTPIYVCATVGSTNSCAIDPVPAIGKICRRSDRSTC